MQCQDIALEIKREAGNFKERKHSWYGNKSEFWLLQVRVLDAIQVRVLDAMTSQSVGCNPRGEKGWETQDCLGTAWGSGMG
jgi:hypothetical protein